MKRKIFILISLIALLPTVFFFSACGKSTKNNLSTLDDEFYAISKEYDNFVFEDGYLKISLVDHLQLNKVVNASNNQYKYLSNYNQMFQSLMCFTSEYVDECANYQPGVDRNTKTKVYNELNALKKEIVAVNSAIETLSGIMAVNTSNPTTSACLVAYENLLLTYEDMFDKAVAFNNSIVDIYYNHALRSGNPNIAALSLDNFAVELVINKLYARVRFQQANLTQSYFKMYLEGGTLAHDIAYGGSLDTSKYNYSSNMNAISFSVDMDEAIQKANANKLAFYNYSVQAYNLQEILSMDIGRFSYACRTICMKDIDSNSTDIEVMCKSIIEENYNTLTQYNNALAGLIGIIK